MGNVLEQLEQVLALDEALLLAVRRLHRPAATHLMRTFTRLGDASSWTFLSLALVALGGAAGRLGWRLGVAALAATVLVQPLKRVCRRRRPSARITGFTALMENPDVFSFPSGHTAAAFAVAIAAAGPAGLLGPLLLALAFAVALSRVYLGAHYPLDVAAGATLGLLAGALARGLV